MALSDFKNKLNSLHRALDVASKEQIDLKQKQSTEWHDFKKQKKSYYATSVESYLTELKKEANLLASQQNTAETSQILALLNQMKVSDKQLMLKTVEEIAEIVSELKEEKKDTGISVILPKNIPAEIKADITADMNELKKCFDNGCYRSTAILCGRILETVLHRKYFETTKVDILETNPGIGLGNLIAKLAEKNVSFDPGLTQQIHLINQVRVFSVHKKQAAFSPSKEQSHAMILYTIDVLNKMWK
jgi:hypothetical protein